MILRRNQASWRPSKGQLHPPKGGSLCMARPDHRDNLIVGWLGKLTMFRQGSPLTRHRLPGPVDRGPSAPGNGTWSVVPSPLAGKCSPGAERFRFSSVVASPEEAVFSLLRECLESGAYHSNPLTLIKNASSEPLNIASIPPTSKEVGFLEVVHR